jgi:O-antigen/teichoic acid export membrane protein
VDQWTSQIVGFSMPMAIGGVFSWGYYASHRWSLELFSSAEELGIFFAISQITYAPFSVLGSFVLALINPILFSRVTDFQDQESIHSSIRVLLVFSGLVLLAGIFASLIFKLYGNWILSLLLDVKFSTGFFLAPFFILAACIAQASMLMSTTLQLFNQNKKLLPLTTFGQSCIVAVNFLFTFYFGLQGLAFSIVLGAALHFVWVYCIITRQAGFSPFTFIFDITKRR